MSEEGSDCVDEQSIWDAIGTIRSLKAKATPFCRVCLRAAPDEKLVPPCSVGVVANALRLEHLWGRGQSSWLACVWCEAAARASLRMFRALRAADAAHAAADAGQLNDHLTATVNARATRHRPRRMRTTQILVITSNGMQAQAPGQLRSPSPPASAQLCSPSSPAAAQKSPAPTPTPALPAWQENMEMVILDEDDDDDTPTPTPTAGPNSTDRMPQTLAQPCFIASGFQYMPTSICITPDTFPIVSQNVPINNIPLSQKLPNGAPINGTMTSGAPINSIPYHSYQPLIVRNSRLPNVVIIQNQGPHFLTQGAALGASALDANALGAGGDLMPNILLDALTGPNGNKRKKPKTEETDDKTDIPLCVVANVVGGSEMPPPPAGDACGNSAVIKSVWAGASSKAATGSGRDVKQPVRNGDKVDWEDKIPMDVISFMDATDPNAGQYIAAHVPPTARARAPHRGEQEWRRTTS